jgi:hypothetical protein
MNPILKQSIETLSAVVNTSTGLAHPLDESRAKELFKALRAYGVPLAYEMVYQLAVSNSWPEKHATALAKLAEKIGKGGRVQIKFRKNWGEPTVQKIVGNLKD